jgi:hypothetical protein
MSKQQSAFKQLFTEMLNQGGDFSKVSKDLKKPLKTYVKESYPFFLVTDGFFFVQAYFTKEAVADFKQKFGNVNIHELSDKVVVINTWSLEMRKVNSAENFTSYGNLEIRLIVHSFKPNLNEKLNPTRYPINLFRDDEFKTQIQQFRHSAIQAALAKSSKGDSLPDIAKVSTASKSKVEGGIVRASSGKGDDFSEFSFKEGNTAVLSIKDIFVQEKGSKAAGERPAEAAAPKVKGGAKGKGKAASKSVAKAAKRAKKRAESAEVKKTVEKVIKYTPSKSQSAKKETPQKTGKVSVKKSVSKKGTMASPSGKKSTKTTDQMTMAQFKQYLDWHEKKKIAGKVLGKRSATSKASAASGKASKASKKAAVKK